MGATADDVGRKTKRRLNDEMRCRACRRREGGVMRGLPLRPSGILIRGRCDGTKGSFPWQVVAPSTGLTPRERCRLGVSWLGVAHDGVANPCLSIHLLADGFWRTVKHAQTFPRSSAATSSPWLGARRLRSPGSRDTSASPSPAFTAGSAEQRSKTVRGKARAGE
jgi:hypothetical protein